MKNRLFSLLLILCLLVPILSGCQTGSGSSQTDDTANKTEGRTDEVYETVPRTYEKDALPKDLNVGREMIILACEEQKNQYYFEYEATANVVNAALYSRSQTVEDRLNATLLWDFHPGQERTAINKFVDQIGYRNMAGEPNVDAVLCNWLAYGNLAIHGNSVDMSQTPYIDESAPWWISACSEELAYQGKIFGMVETYGVGTMRNVRALFFHAGLLKEHEIESPYNLVKNNTWTFDRLMELVKDSYRDLNQNGEKDDGDFYGLHTTAGSVATTFLFGMGHRITRINDEGRLELRLYQSEIDEYVSYMVSANQKDVFFSTSQESAKFEDEKSLFYYGTVGMMESLYGPKNIDFGILPMPKGSVEQTKYYTDLSNTYDVWCIPRAADDLGFSSALVECMASESYRQIAPAYISKYIDLSCVKDKRIVETFDLICSSVTFDLAYCIDYQTAVNMRSVIWNRVTSLDDPSKKAQYQEQNQANFEALLQIYGG